MSTSKPVYLLTPRGINYLDSLKIIKITNTHKDEEIADISTKQIFIATDVEKHESLFERLIKYKEYFKCTFEFAINESGDIALVSILPNGYIFHVFMIKNLGSLELPDFQASEVDSDVRVEEKQENLDPYNTNR